MISRTYPYTSLSHSDPEPFILNKNPPLKITSTIKIRSASANKIHKQIRKDRLTHIDKISIENKSFVSYFTASHLRKLTSNLKQLKSLSCLEIDLFSFAINNTKAIPALFESLKHLKNSFKIHLFPDLSFGFSNIDDQVLSTLCRALENLNSLPNVTIELSFRSCYLILQAKARELLETLANHKCFTFLHWEMSNSLYLPEMEEIIDVLSSSKSLSQIDLILDNFRFKSPAESQSFFRQFKKLKSLKTLKVHFKCCDISFSSLKGAASGLKENTQVRDLQLLCEGRGTKVEISEVEWWLAMRSLRKGTRFQKVKTQSKLLVLVSPGHLRLIGVIIFLVQAMIQLFSYIKSII